MSDPRQWTSHDWAEFDDRFATEEQADIGASNIEEIISYVTEQIHSDDYEES